MGSRRFGAPNAYDKDMARGWESKSVEDQVAEHNDTPIANAKKKESLALASRQRERQALELQRERILDQRTSNPHRRAALEAALADVEAKLKEFE